MEIVSSLNQNKRYSFDVEIFSYLRNHHIEGKVILPAVESLIVLAKTVKNNYPQTELNCLKNASFRRFLTIPSDVLRLTGMVDIKNSGECAIAASFSTSIQSKTGAISRTVEHARVEFSAIDSSGRIPSGEISKSDKSYVRIPAKHIYRDLIDFGPAYHNIVDDLSVSDKGARTVVSGGNCDADDELLGSPFPLDAILHAACVWGQRFAGVVAFPVGFEKRVIHQKTKKGGNYQGCVVPVNITRDMLVFDAWIYKNDTLYESISGIQMKDVSGGRLKPPRWIAV